MKVNQESKEMSYIIYMKYNFDKSYTVKQCIAEKLTKRTIYDIIQSVENNLRHKIKT